MIVEFFVNLFYGLLLEFPVLALPVGFVEGMSFLSGIIGYIGFFLPLQRLAPILALVVMVRNWNIVVAILRFILRFIPFMGGG